MGTLIMSEFYGVTDIQNHSSPNVHIISVSSVSLEVCAVCCRVRVLGWLITRNTGLLVRGDCGM